MWDPLIDMLRRWSILLTGLILLFGGFALGNVWYATDRSSQVASEKSSAEPRQEARDTTPQPPAQRKALPGPQASSAVTSAADVDRGQRLFGQCSICHSVEEGRMRVGPSLYNLFGTIGGTVPGYNFSSAMKEHQIIWTFQNLSAHTEDPRKFTPGTTMGYAGMKSASDRRDLIAYLRVATAIKPTPGIESYDLSHGVFFNEHIGRIFLHYCGECHSHDGKLPAAKVKGTLLQTFEEVTRINTGGPLLVVGHPEQSRLMNFLDGARHFTTLTPLEHDMVRDWIAGGAREGEAQGFTRRLLAEDVRSLGIKEIYCLVMANFTFARLDIFNKETGQLYLSDWFSSTARRWVHWTVAPDTNWPDRVEVSLTLFSGGVSADGGIAAIFVLSKDELSDAMLGKYEEFVTFHKNPLTSSDRSGVFEYFVQRPTDVELTIAASKAGSALLYSKRLRNVAAGKQIERWEFSNQALDKGDYSARFSFADGPQDLGQPDYVILVHAE
jgi:cytochrome c